MGEYLLRKEAKAKPRLYVFVAIALALSSVLAIAVFTVFSTTTPQLRSEFDMPQTLADTTITKEEAIDIAMPHIEAYANENNRIIESVNVTFWSNVKDIWVSRGDRSSMYPEWAVNATFNISEADKNRPQITGYCVLIWADNGEIRSEGPQGFYSSGNV